MKRIIFLLQLCSFSAAADTIEHYINIVNNIPQMEMKADPQSQAWARSARNILILTSESIAESLILANDHATQAHKPLFCLPAGTQISAEEMNNLIQQTYRDISSQASDKNLMTVSQVALIGISKQYPCPSQGNTKIEQFNQTVSRMVSQ